MKYDILDYKEKILKNLKSDWDFGNSILYNMCKDYPLHKEVGIVIGKVWLIGRSYAAAIERMKGRKGNIDDFYIKKIAPQIIHSDIDAKLSGFNQNDEITDKNKLKILESHKYLCNELKIITRQTNRSFVSKYLHFHRPNLFYIYDNIASKVSKKFKINSDKLPQEAIMESNQADKEYANFFLRCYYFTLVIRNELGMEINPRQLDNLLIDVAKNPSPDS